MPEILDADAADSRTATMSEFPEQTERVCQQGGALLQGCAEVGRAQRDGVPRQRRPVGLVGTAVDALGKRAV